MNSLTALTPVEIDTVLAENWSKQAPWGAMVARITAQRREAKPERRDFVIKQTEGDLQKAIAKLRELQTIADPYEAEYRRRPWRRYFLVTNGNGHVHRERHCSTCFPTTQYGWLVQLSGCDETAMVAEYGEQACTVCFPDAPSIYKRLGVTSRSAVEREEKRAARAAKIEKNRADALAKSITNPDGAVLRVGVYGRIETLFTAQRVIVECFRTALDPYVIERNAAYADEHRRDALTIGAAIAAKTGVSVDTILADAKSKAEKTLKKRRSW